VIDANPKPRWLVQCSCGWSTTLSAEWAAQSAAKIHERLGWTAKDHAVSVAQLPREEKDRTEEEPRERDH
jgi:hypothetical protein